EVRERLASAGEPWVSGFHPPELAADLRASGLELLEDLGPAELAERYCRDRTDGLIPSPHAQVARAETSPEAPEPDAGSHAGRGGERGEVQQRHGESRARVVDRGVEGLERGLEREQGADHADHVEQALRDGAAGYECEERDRQRQQERQQRGGPDLAAE